MCDGETTQPRKRMNSRYQLTNYLKLVSDERKSPNVLSQIDRHNLKYSLKICTSDYNIRAQQILTRHDKII